MTIGNLQYYFSTRELLLEAVTRTALSDDLETLEAISENGGQGKARLRDLGSVLISKWLGDSGKIYSAVSSLSHSQPAFRSMLGELYLQLYEYLIPLLKELQPRAHRQTLLDKARLITALLDGAVIQLRNEVVTTSSDERERFVESICTQVVVIGSQ
jgi:AcrR family transcriptional regulator